MFLPDLSPRVSARRATTVCSPLPDPPSPCSCPRRAALRGSSMCPQGWRRSSRSTRTQILNLHRAVPAPAPCQQLLLAGSLLSEVPDVHATFLRLGLRLRPLPRRVAGQESSVPRRPHRRRGPSTGASTAQNSIYPILWRICSFCGDKKKSKRTKWRRPGSDRFKVVAFENEHSLPENGHNVHDLVSILRSSAKSPHNHASPSDAAPRCLARSSPTHLCPLLASVCTHATAAAAHLLPPASAMSASSACQGKFKCANCGKGKQEGQARHCSGCKIVAYCGKK